MATVLQELQGARDALGRALNTPAMLHPELAGTVGQLLVAHGILDSVARSFADAVEAERVAPTRPGTLPN